MNTNNIISQFKFTQIPKGLSKIFKIIPKKDATLEDIKIKLINDIIYYGKYLSAIDLRLFLFLTAQLSTNRRNAKLVKTSETIEMLSAEFHTNDKYNIRIPLINWDAYTGIRNILKYFDLKVMSENINIASTSLSKLENTNLYTNTVKAKLISLNHKVLVFHPIFSSLFKSNFKNHNITPKLYPLTTVRMDVAKELTKRNTNKLVLYYFLCDNVNFKEKVDISINSFSSLWIKEEENRKTKSFRRKFILETLKEIEELSQDFKITFKNNHITVERYPDIKKNDIKKNIKHKNQAAPAKTDIENILVIYKE